MKALRDLQALQSTDERTQGTHLPQEEKVEVSGVQPSQDAGTKAAAKTISGS
jgi:hypothetical protein